MGIVKNALWYTIKAFKRISGKCLRLTQDVLLMGRNAMGIRSERLRFGRYKAEEDDLVVGEGGQEVPDVDMAANNEVEGVKDLL